MSSNVARDLFACRRKLRGARHFIFYGPPTFPWFVRELISVCDVAPAAATNAAGETMTTTPHKDNALSCSVTILYFPPWEAHQVSMITGTLET